MSRTNERHAHSGLKTLDHTNSRQAIGDTTIADRRGSPRFFMCGERSASLNLYRKADGNAPGEHLNP